MKYRFSTKRPEIIKTLSSKLTNECTLTVWQKQADGTRRFLEKMTFHALHPSEGVFTLKGIGKDVKHIDPSKEIYFLLEGHDFIFKTKMAVEQKEFMTFQIPKEVRLRELRIHERKYFKLEDKIFVDVVFTIKNSDNDISLSCPLVNISDGGACIIVSKETISNINFSADVLLKITTDFQKAMIRNARIFIKKNLNKDELYAIGVQFQ